MARPQSKDPLPGIFLLGLLCLGIGLFVRYKASQAAEKLRTWTRVTAAVAGVEPFQARTGRYGTKTRYAATVRYTGPGGGPAVGRVVLFEQPTTSDIFVYCDPADPARSPEPEVSLQSVTSRTNFRVANGFVAGGVVALAGAGYALRRRLASR